METYIQSFQLQPCADPMEFPEIVQQAADLQ